MASIILGAAGAALGGATGVPYLSSLGGMLGRSLGSSFDSEFFASGKNTHYEGARLADLAVQSSTYGKMIPIIYGTMRVGGNLIWSRPIKEMATMTTSSSRGGGKGGGGKVSQTSTTYSYSATLAVGICAGPVDELLRVWADAKQLDISQYIMRIYKGDEEQLPDSLIQAFEGIGKTPAYRGLCYVVFEDFPLASFGNRIPNFTFEVKKKVQYADYEGELLEDMLTGIVMIPGAGEYVYDTVSQAKIPGINIGGSWVAQGDEVQINTHTPYGKTNALVSLDQLEKTCPNIEWVSVVVSWFGDSLDAGACTVVPGVEYKTGAVTAPDTWQVAGFDRSNARLITYVGGGPQYGGTPDDSSILRYLEELRSRGYKVAFYPLMFMDMAGKPWRGELTGSAADVGAFFSKTNGYNAYIMHYANLVQDKVDAFIIGSELKGLTSVSSTPGQYPAVDALVSLALSVKAVVGAAVKVTYAADWSEYHHTTGGWYNLDPLWSSTAIDVIGIDAYFPLTDAPQAGYDIDTIKAGWQEGEYYDWYYSDSERTLKTALSPAYALKNIECFWNNVHVNPDASVTGWVPGSKKIWFTEFGFPSVDGASNQPNVFYDPATLGGAFPHYSRGRVDLRAQRAALVATQAQWKDSPIVENMFLWAWDARPYPYWPDLATVWSDGGSWKTGHWVQGKLGISSLAAIISDLCLKAGLTDEDVDATALNGQIEGFIINRQQSLRKVIESLQKAYFFDNVESDGLLRFIPRGGISALAITEVQLVPSKDGHDLLTLTRTQEAELPKRVNVLYINRLLNYQSSAQYAQREVTASRETQTLDFAIVMPDQTAKSIADITLFQSWAARTSYQFSLPVRYASLEPSDVITLIVAGVSHRMRILSTRLKEAGIIEVHAVAEDLSVYDFYSEPGKANALLQEINTVPQTQLYLLDLPCLPGQSADSLLLHTACRAAGAYWPGAGLYRSDDNGANYTAIADAQQQSVTGIAVNALTTGPTTVFDEESTLDVALSNEDDLLQSVTELAVLNGANVAMVGNEIIQFRTATLTAQGRYTLSGLLRGRLGTEWTTAGHAPIERFVLLDSRLGLMAIPHQLIGLSRKYKAVTYGNSLVNVSAQDFTFNARALKPYSPVHIRATRNGAGDIDLNWIRRTRSGGEWRDYVDVALAEQNEAYEVDIYQGASVVRTLASTATSVSYSAAQQTTDFGGVQASVTIKLYQLSARVGRGYAAQATV